MAPGNRNTAREHLHDALETLFQSISPEDFPSVDNWLVGFGPTSGYKERTPYWSHTDSHDTTFSRDNTTTVLRFHYTPTGERVRSQWVSQTNYIAVRFGSDWDPQFDRDDGGGKQGVSANEESSAGGSAKYMIGGPLSDPIVTGDVDRAADTVRDQFSRVKAGTTLNHIFEVLAGNGAFVRTSEEYRSSLPEVEDLPDDPFADDVETSSPIRTVSGIGDATIARFGSRVGVYPNLRNAGYEELSDLMPGYDNNPDLDEVNAICTAITEHYLNLCERDDWPGPNIDVDRFDGYPIGNPTDSGGI